MGLDSVCSLGTGFLSSGDVWEIRPYCCAHCGLVSLVPSPFRGCPGWASWRPAPLLFHLCVFQASVSQPFGPSCPSSVQSPCCLALSVVLPHPPATPGIVTLSLVTQRSSSAFENAQMTTISYNPLPKNAHSIPRLHHTALNIPVHSLPRFLK